MIKSTPRAAAAMAIGGGAASWGFMSVNSLLAVVVAALTAVLLMIRIAIAWREWRLLVRHEKKGP